MTATESSRRYVPDIDELDRAIVKLPPESTPPITNYCCSSAVLMNVPAG